MNLDSLLGFFCVLLLLCLQNTRIDTDFDILKYIKYIFKASTSLYFVYPAEDNIEKSSRESELIPHMLKYQENC